MTQVEGIQAVTIHSVTEIRGRCHGMDRDTLKRSLHPQSDLLLLQARLGIFPLDPRHLWGFLSFSQRKAGYVYILHDY